VAMPRIAPSRIRRLGDMRMPWQELRPMSFCPEPLV